MFPRRITVLTGIFLAISQFDRSRITVDFLLGILQDKQGNFYQSSPELFLLAPTHSSPPNKCRAAPTARSRTDWAASELCFLVLPNFDLWPLIFGSSCSATLRAYLVSNNQPHQGCYLRCFFLPVSTLESTGRSQCRNRSHLVPLRSAVSARTLENESPFFRRLFIYYSARKMAVLSREGPARVRAEEKEEEEEEGSRPVEVRDQRSKINIPNELSSF